jgi:Domain of unknown function (DUF4041)/T5orf172 domain
VAYRYVSPPNWPSPPPGWVPPEGWVPPSDWSPAPAGWQFWLEDSAAPMGVMSASTPWYPAAIGTAVASPPIGGYQSPGAPVATSPIEEKVGLFGARQRVKELNAEVGTLRAELSRLGFLDVVELEQHRQQLGTEIQEREAELAADLQAHGARLEDLTNRQVAQSAAQVADLTGQVQALNTQLAELQMQVAVTQEQAILQEVGIYQYRHPLSDAPAYQAELSRLGDAVKAMAARDGGAIEAATSWTVNGSAAQGRTMVREYSKLMLRAYNAEADNLVRGLKPYKLATSIDRLNKVALTIERLGKTMSIRISTSYHQLRIRELELTADFLEKQAEQKEREREEKARLREERQAQLEMQRERERLDRERQHHLNALAALEASGDIAGADRLRAQLADVDKAIAEVDYRAANIRAGYVYVISNVGSFGPTVIKVGMTRRLDPRDRVRELSDASVPFNFDVHALFFSADAVGIETKMHQLLADKRVNRVNSRREFFYATPTEARGHLASLSGEILEFVDVPEAVEFHQSETEIALAAGASPGRHSASTVEAS